MDNKKYTLTRTELQKIKMSSIEMREDILSLCHNCYPQKSHLGGCMSAVDILAVLYLKIMNIRIARQGIIPWDSRDRFIMSKGHGSMAMYAALKQIGVLSDEIINGSVRGDNTFIYRHPKKNTQYAIECSVGSLGMGLSYGAGLVEAFNRKGQPHIKVYVMLGDGECNEGAIWEAAAYISHKSLNNLAVIIDHNGLQLDGKTKDILSINNMAERWQAFGFKTVEIDGHNIEQIYNAFMTEHFNKPLAIIANTVKGKGIPFAENKTEWHDNYLTDELYKIAIRNLATEKGKIKKTVNSINRQPLNKSQYPEYVKYDKLQKKVELPISSHRIKIWNALGSQLIVGEAARLIAEQDQLFTLIYADCANRIGIEAFSKLHKEKGVEIGIAEQNEICIGSAMANEGFHVFAVAYAPFITARVLDQIRVNMGYMKAPLKLIGLTAGFAAGDLGATHTALEDIGNLRGIPNIIVISPADCTEALKAMAALTQCDQPAYLRLTNGSSGKKIYDSDYKFDIGKAIILKEGSDVAIVSCGAILEEVLCAAESLLIEGITCQVINMHTIKPLDTEMIDNILSYKMIITVEEHNVIGGLGSAVSEILAKKSIHPPIVRIGVPDTYYVADLPHNLLKKSGLTANKIAECILDECKKLKIL